MSRAGGGENRLQEYSCGSRPRPHRSRALQHHGVPLDHGMPWRRRLRLVRCPGWRPPSRPGPRTGRPTANYVPVNLLLYPCRPRFRDLFSRGPQALDIILTSAAVSEMPSWPAVDLRLRPTPPIPIMPSPADAGIAAFSIEELGDYRYDVRSRGRMQPRRKYLGEEISSRGTRAWPA